MVPKQNATRLGTTILTVVAFKMPRWWLHPTEVPSRMTTIYISALLAVSASQLLDNAALTEQVA